MSMSSVYNIAPTTRVNLVNMAAEVKTVEVSVNAKFEEVKEELASVINLENEDEMPSSLIKIYKLKWDEAGEYTDGDEVENFVHARYTANIVMHDYKGNDREEQPAFRYICEGPDKYMGVKNREGFIRGYYEKSIGERRNFRYFEKEPYVMREVVAARWFGMEEYRDYGFLRWMPNYTQPRKTMGEAESGELWDQLLSRCDRQKDYTEFSGGKCKTGQELEERSPQDFNRIGPTFGERRVGESGTYPTRIPRVMVLAVAAMRGCDLDTVQIIMGGSALFALMSRGEIEERETGEVQMVRKVNGIVSLESCTEFEVNYTDHGHQFRKFCTDGEMGTAGREKLENVHTMKVGDIRVLLSTGVDGIMRGNNEPVKMTLSRRGLWGPAMLLRCVTGGIEKIMHGEKGNKGTGNRIIEYLDIVSEYDIDMMAEVILGHLTGVAWTRLRNNLERSIGEVIKGMENVTTETYWMKFRRNEMVLEQVSELEQRVRTVQGEIEAQIVEMSLQEREKYGGK